MEKYVNKFLELLKCVDYIQDEKVKIQMFFSWLPPMYIDIIEFVDPQTLYEVIIMDMHCCDQSKEKSKFQWAWKGKQKGKFEQR